MAAGGRYVCTSSSTAALACGACCHGGAFVAASDVSVPLLVLYLYKIVVKCHSRVSQNCYSTNCYIYSSITKKVKIRQIPRLDHEWPGAKQQDEGNNNPLFCLRNDAYEVWDGRFHSYEHPTTKRPPLTLIVECGLWSAEVSHDLVEPTIAVSVWYPASTPALQRTQFGVEREAWRSPSHDLVQPQTIDPSSRLVRRSVSRSHCLLSPPWPLFGGEGREGSFDNRSILPVNIPWTLATGRRRG